MTTTTNVAQVKLNIMTQEQYDNSLKSDTELYVITDASPIPIDNELSLLSENPVKNSVLTTRSNQIQTELNDKLSKSAVWNKLNKAYGWTYRHINGSGNAYMLYGNLNSGISYSDAYSAQEILENQSLSDTGESNVHYVCLDKQLYYRVYDTSTNTFTLSPLLGNNCTCFVTRSLYNSNYCAIVDNNLYVNGSLRDSGGWTKITRYDGLVSTSSSDYGLGIKNGSLYFINSSSIIQKDNTGTWSDIIGCVSGTNFFGAGIKDGKLYSIGLNDIIELSSETGWSQLCGGDIPTYNSQILLLKNNKIYMVVNRTLSLLEGTNTWIKITGSCDNGGSCLALTQDGKIYRSYSANISSPKVMIQIGTDDSWTDISGTGYSGYAIKDGDVYLIYNDDITKITTFGNITKVYGKYYSYSDAPLGYFWTGSVTEDVHSVYTVATPSVGFYTYSDINLQNVGTISAISSAPYTITDQYYTYTRDTSLDGVFTGISPNSSNISMTIFDLLNCLTD